MAPTSSFFTPAILFFLLFLSPSIHASNGRFQVELIHRDSPKSPFYKSEETPHQRISNALHRSRRRHHRFRRPKSEVWSDDGDYIMNISIGTPPFEIIAVADTGSDLIWTQCKPCKHCFEQERPMFDPKSSKTYKDLSCSSQVCRNVPQSTCKDDKCQYVYKYGDGSHTTGNLATETITLSSTRRRPFAFPGSIFGCGHDNGGIFSNKSSGIIGLGGGPLSLISQLDHLFHGKLSYCLVPYESTTANSSTMFFGPHSVPKGPGVHSTPLLSIDHDTYYYLLLESFSVGNTTIKMSGSSPQTPDNAAHPKPNIIIDSGTTMTFIPDDVHRNLSAAVDKLIDAKPAKDPNGQFSPCYTSKSFKEAPMIVAHFHGGADVKLGTSSTFIAISEDVVCFALAGTQSSFESPSIFGNLAQMNYLVAYDLKRRTVSFKQMDCTKV